MALNIRDLVRMGRFHLELGSLGTVRCTSLSITHLSQVDKKLRALGNRRLDFIRWLFGEMAQRHVEECVDKDDPNEDRSFTIEELNSVTDGELEQFAEKLIQENGYLLDTHKGSDIERSIDESNCDFFIRATRHYAAEQKAQWERITRPVSELFSTSTMVGVMQQSTLDAMLKTNRYGMDALASLASRCEQDLMRAAPSLAQDAQRYLAPNFANSMLAKAIYRNEDMIKGTSWECARNVSAVNASELEKQLQETRNLWISKAAFGDTMKAMQEGMRASTHAYQAIAASFISSDFGQVMKTYENAQKHWMVPAELIDSVASLKAMQGQIGRLTLPVIDWASAASLAKMLGPEGIKAQLAALGIDHDGTIAEEVLQEEEQGIGLSRKALELMTLLSVIFTFLFSIYQEISSREQQRQLNEKLDAIESKSEVQAKTLEALSRLVEKAFIQETKRTDARFVVLDHVAIVRDEPRHGSTVKGKLLPREVVKPVAEQGKWIQFEYYHWVRQEYQIGWALKKYFKRVSASHN